MLKHCSQSCVDVSRRSLRQKSFTLDSRYGVSADMLDEIDKESDQDFRSFCVNSSFSGMVTLPRNKPKPVTESSLSLPNFSNITAIKVYAQCLRPHLAYKTVIITRHTTSRQVVLGLLSRFRMKHRDPRLFFLTMEVNIGEEKSRTIALEDSTCIADLITCNPWGTCRFRLKARQGGLIKIYDGEVRTDSVYKSIIISQDTSVEDTLHILGSCYGTEDGSKLELYEVDLESGEQRLLAPQEKPLEVKEDWDKLKRKVFQLRRTEDESEVDEAFPCDSVESEVFSRGLVRNSVLRQSVRKKQFLKSMISERSVVELEAKNLFSMGRFSLSDQIISESGEDIEECGSSDAGTRISEGELNCSTSGVSSLSCSSLDSIGGGGGLEQDSFFT